MAYGRPGTIREALAVSARVQQRQIKWVYPHVCLCVD